MKLTKGILSVILSLTVIITIVTQSASAAEVSSMHLYEFGRFNKVVPSSNYAVAAVAVQKFLMLYGHSYAQALQPYGADGYYGDATEAQVKRFQREVCPHGGTPDEETGHDEYGKVDHDTWIAIAHNLQMTELYDTAGALFHRFNRSYYELTENLISWNGAAYYAYEENAIAPIPYPFHYN